MSDDAPPPRFEDEHPEAAATLMALAQGELIPPLPVHWFVRRDGTIIEYATRIGGAIIATVSPSIGRNDPCPCASGKKFKKCCMA